MEKKVYEFSTFLTEVAGVEDVGARMEDVVTFHDGCHGLLREYVTTSKLVMPNLQATHVGQLSQNQYYSVYGGYLESMFAGVGGEWLYRPFASRVALGVDANFVQQRDFRQDFGFSDAGDQTGYRVATGHGTLYWDTGWNDVLAKVSVGRYLAKDIGATFDLSRSFDNGVSSARFSPRPMCRRRPSARAVSTKGCT